jgi:hypothetical protein
MDWTNRVLSQAGSRIFFLFPLRPEKFRGQPNSLSDTTKLLLLEKLPGAQSLKNIPIFHGTRRLITVFTRALHLSLSWTRWIQSIPPHHIYLRSILILSSHLPSGLPSGLLPSGFPTKTLFALIFGPCYMPYQSHPPSLHHSNYIWRRVQVTRLLNWHFFPTSYYFIPFRSKYSPQHPVLKYLQSMFLP